MEKPIKSHDARRAGLWRLPVGLAALLFVGQVQALGLGKLKVLSALDEPLNAEIELTAATQKDLETLQAELGSAEDFQRADVQRSEFLGALEFRVRKGAKPAIVINTAKPAQEPFLHFLVSVNWADGKLVREYTALLDPPLYAAEPTTAVSSPGVVEEVQRRRAGAETAAPAGGGGGEPTSGTTVSTFGGAEYGPTVRGDTLWGIASRFDARGYDVNVFQIMIALLRENPDAFIDNNVNRLKVGQILRLSDLEAARSISPKEASVAYQTQLQEWLAYKGAVAEATEVTMVPAEGVSQTSPQKGAAQAEPAAEGQTAAGEQQMASATDRSGETSGAGKKAATAAEEKDLLKIVQATLDNPQGESAASSGAKAAPQEGQAAADKELGTLRSQISTLEESLASRELENKELSERVTLLEKQVADAQRLVQVQSQELALAQQQAADAQRQAEQQTADAQQQVAQAQQQAQQQAAQAQQQAAQARQQAERQVAQAQQQAQQQAAQAQQQAEQQVAQAQQQAEQQVAQAQQQAAQDETQSTATLAQNVLEPIPEQQPKAKKTRVIAGGDNSSRAQPAVNRPPAKSWWQSGVDMIVGSSMSLIAVGVGLIVLLAAALLFIRRRRSIAEFEESILSGSGLDEQTESTDTAASNKGTDTSFLSDFGMAGMGSMQADEVDPLAEAEVYLAYGRDEQAEEVLKEAVARNPTRHELKLKLLEIYQQRDDVKSFETLAEELYPAGGQGDQATWDKVVEMGLKMNPDNPLFARELPGSMAPPLSEDDASELMLPEAAEAEDAEQELPQDIVKQSSTPVDPGLKPFPQPDKNAGLDEEFERLANRMADPESGGDDEEEVQDEKEAAENDDMMQFAASDASDLDFELDLGGEEEEQPARTEAARPADDEMELELELEEDAGKSDEDEAKRETMAATTLDFDGDDFAITRSDGSSAGDNGDANKGDDSDDADTVETAQWDEAATKLDLAQAYLNMGDKAGARSIIDEVMKEGSPAQRNQAADLAARLG